MYAIFQDGGRQYRVEEGSVINLDYRESKVGDRLDFSTVMLVGGTGKATVGQPFVKGAMVVAEVVDFPKVKTVAQSFRRRKASKRLRGHTQPHVRVKIVQVLN
jgi:large subunit ribosomal protein L21